MGTCSAYTANQRKNVILLLGRRNGKRDLRRNARTNEPLFCVCENKNIFMATVNTKSSRPGYASCQILTTTMITRLAQLGEAFQDQKDVGVKHHIS